MTKAENTSVASAGVSVLGMTKRRVTIVSAMLLGVVALHAYATAAGHDRWPFCTYPMYSKSKAEDTIVHLRIFGVRLDGTETQMLGNEHLRPFDQSRIAESMLNMTLTAEMSRRHVQGLTNALDRYERQRQAGRHDGPELTQLRLYRTRHDLKPWAVNLHSPEERVLLAESEAKPGAKADVRE